MVSFKYSLLILLIAVLDLVRAEDGAYIVARLIQTLIVVVILVLMGVAIYKCVKNNEKFYNDGDYTTSQTQIVPATVQTGFTAPTGLPPNQTQPATQYSNTQYPTQYANSQYPAPQPTQYSNNQYATQYGNYGNPQYGNPKYPAPQATQYDPQFAPPNQYSTAANYNQQAPPAYGQADYDSNKQFGQFTAKY